MFERQRIVITVGLPGSGKSTYLAGLGVNAISSDNVRRLLIDDPGNQTIHARVFATMRYLLRQRLAAGRLLTYVDATHLTREERRPYVEIARWYRCDLDALVFNVPVEICIERNRGRIRVVPEEAIRLMAAKLRKPAVEEGFRSIVIGGSG